MVRLWLFIVRLWIFIIRLIIHYQIEYLWLDCDHLWSDYEYSCLNCDHSLSLYEYVWLDCDYSLSDYEYSLLDCDHSWSDIYSILSNRWYTCMWFYYIETPYKVNVIFSHSHQSTTFNRIPDLVALINLEVMFYGYITFYWNTFCITYCPVFIFWNWAP